jgi:hypothetical protein
VGCSCFENFLYTGVIRRVRERNGLSGSHCETMRLPSPLLIILGCASLPQYILRADFTGIILQSCVSASSSSTAVTPCCSNAQGQVSERRPRRRRSEILVCVAFPQIRLRGTRQDDVGQGWCNRRRRCCFNTTIPDSGYPRSRRLQLKII